MNWQEQLYKVYFTYHIFIRAVVVSLVILGAFYIFQKIFKRIIFVKIMKLASKTKYSVDNKILSAFKRPIEVFIILAGFYFAIDNLSIYIGEYFAFKDFDVFLAKCLRSALVLSVAWGFYILESTSSFIFQGIMNKLQLNFDQIIIPFLSKFLRIITVALAFIIVIQEWGYNVNGFIAGLGLGGLAFALAAQDTLANIFGGIVIIFDKPFTIGDWIVGSDIEGVVEDINFRSTRIRRFDDALVTIPNSVLAGSSIVNWSKMGKRKISFNLGATYSTPKEKLELCIVEIKNMLQSHPEVQKDTIHVRFNNFNSSSLDIFIYFFTVQTVWGEYLKVKEDILFEIMEIFEKTNVQFAFPSQSVYFETPLKVDK